MISVTKHMIFKNLLRGLFVVALSQALSGCVSDRTAAPAAYYHPNAAQYAEPPTVRRTPDYYYRQPTAYPAQQPYGYRAPVAASRTYNDPYAFQPSPPQYPYYESDDTYVPPNFYGSPDNVVGGGGGIHGL